MKKKACLILLFLFFSLFNIKASALTYGGCAYSDVARLKAFVSNINISYDYYIQNNMDMF